MLFLDGMNPARQTPDLSVCEPETQGPFFGRLLAKDVTQIVGFVNRPHVTARLTRRFCVLTQAAFADRARARFDRYAHYGIGFRLGEKPKPFLERLIARLKEIRAGFPVELQKEFPDLKAVAKDDGRLDAFMTCAEKCNLVACFGLLAKVQERATFAEQLKQVNTWLHSDGPTEVSSMVVRKPLSSLPEIMGALPNLRRLHLHKTQLVSMIDWPGGLDGLRVFSLCYNNLPSIPSWVAELKKLSSLYLDFNGLVGLPEEIGELPFLLVLTLNHNRVYSLPDSFVRLKRLRVLLLRDNRFRVVPEQLKELDQLHGLDLGGNQITRLPDWMEEFKKNRRVGLRRNPLPDPSSRATAQKDEESFGDDDEVEELSLSRSFSRLRINGADEEQRFLPRQSGYGSFSFGKQEKQGQRQVHGRNECCCQ